MTVTRFYGRTTNVSGWTAHSFEVEKVASETQGSTSTTVNSSVAGASSQSPEHGLLADEGASHNSADWPTSGYGYSYDVATSDAALSYYPGIMRVSSAKTTGRDVDGSGGTFVHLTFGETGTGIKTGTGATITTINSDASRASSDFFGWGILVDNSNMMTAFTLGIRYDDADTWIECTNFVNSLGTPQIVCPVIAASSTIPNPTIINTQEINFNVLNVPGSILTPSIVPPPSTVQLQVITATSTVNSPTIVQNIIVPVINAPSSLFNPSTKYDVILPVVVTSSNINNPSVLHRFLISMQVITADSTIFSPTVNQDIALNVINSTSTVHSPALDYNVVLPVINAPDNVLQPATDTSVNIEMLFIADGSTIFDPALNQDIVFPTLTATETVPNPTVTQAGAGQTINYEVINAASAVLNPSVTTLTTVTAQVLDSPSTVLSPSLKYDVVLPVVTTVSTIFSPSLEQIVQMQLVNTAPTVYAPRIGEEVDDGFSGAIIDRPGFPPFPIGIR